MSNYLLTITALAVAGVAAVSIFLFLRKRRARSRAVRATVEALAIERELDTARTSFLKGEKATAKEVVRLELALSDRKADLVKIRAQRLKKKDTSVLEMLEELGL